MRRHLAAILILVAQPTGVLAEVPPGTCSAPSTAPAAVAEALDGVLTVLTDPEHPLAARYGHAPAAVISVRTPDWTHVAAAGLADPDTGAPVDCGMPFQIGSNTKMMTATVILQLMEEGRLSVDDLLSTHLPDMAARLPFGEAITLRQLLDHTSGVFSYTDNAPDGTPGLMDGDTSDPAALVRPLAPEEAVDFVAAHGAPYFAPGAEGEWAYSNTGYTLLGLIVERAEGAPLAEVFDRRIFQPLGMTDTFFWNDVPGAELGLPRTWFAAPFDYETTDWNMSQGWAAGAVISTAEDMHRFMAGLLGGELFEDAATLGLMEAGGPTTNPALLRYGLGLALKGDDLWGHGGQTLGFMSDVAAAGDGSLSMVLWTTSGNNLGALGVQLVTQALVASAP
ncbi:serine hydrolase [Rhodobacterales bacterium HKCCSP123]|nr:serine hydrolase [Rhodobacterales bacterium HKCCSP123]